MSEPRGIEPTKIDAAREAMEREHIKKLALVLCDRKFAKANPALYAMTQTLNDDMREMLRKKFHDGKI